MKDAEISLPYWKQGDDMKLYLEDCDNNVVEALELHASNMELGGKMLRQIRDVVAGHDIEIYACTHSIEIAAEDTVIDQLVELGLADILEPNDEEEGCEAETTTNTDNGD